MKIPLSWLKEFINIEHSAVQIADMLTSAGLEVDAIENVNSTQSDSDVIYEISLTPNLGHCSNITGVARELSAMTGAPLCFPLIQVTESKELAEEAAQVIVEDTKGCPRYACRIIKNVRLGNSPDWLQKRLTACGVRPINNVVDATNFIMLEMGQPLHAFDYEKLEGHGIVVRSAKEDEHFITLDGKEHVLKSSDIVICDKQKPIALAGIMGGLNSEVSDQTQNILLEAAFFNPSHIRKTSKRLGLQTDSSRRFERSCDPNAIIQALDRAAMLIQEFAQGEVLAGIIDSRTQDFTEKVVQCRLSRINEILGTHLSLGEVEEIFSRLNLQSRWNGSDAFHVTVPTYRADISAEIDLIEEVARIYGYNNIEKCAMRYQTSSIPHTPMFMFERLVRSKLIGHGLQEFITCDLIGPTISNIAKEHLMPEEAIVRVLNPTSIEQSILRTSLMPGLLQLVKYNLDHQNHNISGFEIGRTHFKEANQFKEVTVVGIVLSGKKAPHHWEGQNQNVDFYDLKGIIENFLIELGVSNAVYKPSQYKSFHTGRQASIFVNELELGSMGEIHPAILRRLDVSQRILFAEISLPDLMSVRKEMDKMEPLPIYPCSERDWTLTVPEGTSVQEILALIRASTSSLLEDISLIAVFRSEKIGMSNKNLTFRFVYRDKEKTIDQATVDREHGRIVSAVSGKIESK